MKIQREIAGQTVEFELTNEELYSAYFEQELFFQRDDAQKALADFAGVDFEVEFPVDTTFEQYYAEELREFKENFKIDFNDAINYDSPFCVIDKIVKSYNENFSAENAPSDAWHWACKDVLCDIAHEIKNNSLASMIQASGVQVNDKKSENILSERER